MARLLGKEIEARDNAHLESPPVQDKEKEPVATKLIVLGTERETPAGFPGETGTLGFLRVCPPVDVGEFRFIPQVQVAHWSVVIPDLADVTAPYVPLELPQLDQIPTNLDGTRKIGSSFVCKHNGSPETVLEVLSDTNGRPVMAVYFVGSILRFRLRTLEVEIDCGWAAGIEGLAFVRWEPGRIAVCYYAPQLDGPCELRSVTSDVHIADSTALLVLPGDNLDTFERRAKNREEIPTLSCGVAVCLLSRAPLPPYSVQSIARQYGEALRALISVEHADADQIVGIPIHVRNQVVDDVLFDAWRSAMGYPKAWGGEASCVLVSSECSREVLEEIQDLQAYASLTEIMKDAGIVDELVPPPRMAGRNPTEVLWHHVAHKRILDDSKSWQLRDALQAAVWSVGRRVVLQCEHLVPLYEFIGTDWLETQAAKARQRLAGKRVNPGMFADVHPAVLGWMWLREDVILDDGAHQDAKVRAWGWLSQLANDLEQLGELTPTATPTELVRRLQSDGHLQAAFEAKIAAILTEVGNSPTFVPTGSGRSPDLEVAQGGVRYFVECCQKAPNSEDDARALNLANDLAASTLGRAVRAKASALVSIALEEALTPTVSHEVRKLLEEVAWIGERKVDGVAIEASELCAWGDIHESKELSKRAPGQADLVYVGGERLAFWPATRVMHASVVAIEMKLERNLLKSLEDTLDNKGRWISKEGQIPDDSLGVLALGLGDCSRATVQKLAPLLKAQIERAHAAVSVILLVWDERDHQDMLTCMLTTQCLPIINARAEKPWPESLRLPIGDVRGFGLTERAGPPLRKRTSAAPPKRM